MREIFQTPVLLLFTLLAVLAHTGEAAAEDHEDLALKENYDNFFHFVDSFLWDTEDIEGRMYRRGKT